MDYHIKCSKCPLVSDTHVCSHSQSCQWLSPEGRPVSFRSRNRITTFPSSFRKPFYRRRTCDDVTDDDDESEQADWRNTEVEREHNWYNVSGLLHGRTYRLRVAAVDRHGDMMKSEYVEIVVGIHPGI